MDRAKRHPLDLKNVTLLSANGTSNSDLSLSALEISARHIQFGSIKLLAAVNPERLIPPGIEFIRVPQMDLAGYNKFSIKRFVNYVKTDFVLIVQPDGFVLNPKNWRADFLNYDYIGAPWPKELCDDHPDYRVGNSGFCLRSRRFLEQTSRLRYSPGSIDDVLFCRRRREKLEAQGIRYAPPKIAARFSVELPVPENPRTSTQLVFGFHGRCTQRTNNLCEWLCHWNEQKIQKGDD
jgi:Protein of unknown function (DUF5672)